MVLKYVSANTCWKYLKSASISGCSGLGSGGSKPGSSISSQAGRLMPQALDRPSWLRYLSRNCLRNARLAGTSGELQGAVGQGIAGLRIITGTGPGQFVVGEITDQPGVITVITGGDGDGPFGSHGEAWIERIRHAAPPVLTGADAHVITNDRQRQGVGHALGLTQLRVAPVAEGVEAPGLQAIQRVVRPTLGIGAVRGAVSCRGRGDGLIAVDGGHIGIGSASRLGWRCGLGAFLLAKGALDVGAIEIEPAPLIELAIPVGAGIAVVVAFTVVGRQRLTRFGEVTEYLLPAFDIGLAVTCGHGIDPQRVERVAFWRHQIPTVTEFLGTEEPAGLERRAVEPAAELVLGRAIGQPGLELLLFPGRAGF